ncbi:MAG: glycoside hydrolase family 3 C-terminal domain-containing protein [Tannerella sp.]|jgi:beta-glucosidase|nr:glycoside hydrolase family 3 C-terminal domain-containing protein [Tannerella sp.]
MKHLFFNIIFLFIISIASLSAQKKGITSVAATTALNPGTVLLDGNPKTVLTLQSEDLKAEQRLSFTLQTPSNVESVAIDIKGITKEMLQKWLDIYVTYDPMNPGEAVKYGLSGNFTLKFPPQYGAHVILIFKGGVVTKQLSISEIELGFEKTATETASAVDTPTDKPWMNAQLPVDERVELLLAVMTPADKMELIREGWGIPGIPKLGIPDIKKVEAVHGFSYGSGATIFPQAIALGAAWNKRLAEKVAETVGDETRVAGAIQAWSPVLDVAQDARWGRCEETFGEDPILVSEIGGAWIKGYQSKGLMTTPKHFAIHGAPLGGRDSHDVGLSEREIREVHLVPFRHVIRKYNCQSLMMAYSDYLGVPVAKSAELLIGILREEWGFNGFIVSDCGAIGNLTARKHYTAENLVEAANQSLAAGIATNCGNTYNNKDVIEAAKNGGIDMQNLDMVCRTLLSTMLRNGLFENNPSKALDWNKIYPGWQSPEHLAVAREAARQSIVLLENKNNILPIVKTTGTIAVIGPGADDLQPGDYSPKLQEGQLKSVLTGIKAAVGAQTKIIYEKGCEFTASDNYEGEKARQAALKADVVVMVLGDCTQGNRVNYNTTGENHDYATLELPGKQGELLREVCATGKPVVLVMQIGRPYNLTYAAEHCAAMLVNWLPGQEGGYATADVLFGDYNPAGRLPMTFPRHVGQLPHYYNFKTSGRRYEYSDLEYYPLYRFGYGISYTKFEYSNLQTSVNSDGNVTIKADVKNTGSRQGDEVVQLYLTDMYASVKTRVMELKDFERITLAAGESETVAFTLSPYQLSLLNDKMDRVVEPGDFKICVGGRSPSYKAGDRIKESVGYGDKSEGVSAILNYKGSYAADFNLTLSGTEEKLADGSKKVFVKVKNTGNLMDTGKLYLYADGVRTNEIHHYELAAGEEKQIAFFLPVSQTKQFSLTSKYRQITINL